MAYECSILQLVLLEEGFCVFCEGGVVVDLIVGGFAMISRVDGVYGTLEDACECARISCQSQSSYDNSREIPYFPTPWLFLLLPNKPCTITIGSPFALPESSWSRYARSTTLKFADAWNERVHDGEGVAFDSCVRLACFERVNAAEKGCMLLVKARMLKV